MYCPQCEKEVQTKREDINWAILVVLTIFTAGIGVLIYLSVYFRKPMNHCVYCNSVCYIKETERASISLQETSSSSANYNSNQAITTIKKERIDEDNNKQEKNYKYCINCGAEIGNRKQLNFCAYCGFEFE
jgi:hypothetical protein